MVNVVVLGTTASLPTKDAVPSCFAVKHGGNFLFDCCEGVQRQCMKFGVSVMRIEAVFISHLHADHFLGLFGLLQSLNLMRRMSPMLVVGPKGTEAFFKAILALKPLAVGYPVVFKEAGGRATTVFENKLFKITAFPVKHTPGALGYSFECHSYRRFDEAKARAAGVHGRLFSELQEKGSLKVDGKTVKFAGVSYLQAGKKIVYSGDTAACASLARAAKGADLLVHEATFAAGEARLAKEKLHSTTLQAAAVAAKAKCKKLLLTHFSNRYADKSLLLAEAQAAFPNTVIAVEGLELEV